MKPIALSYRSSRNKNDVVSHRVYWHERGEDGKRKQKSRGIGFEPTREMQRVLDLTKLPWERCLLRARHANWIARGGIPRKPVDLLQRCLERLDALKSEYKRSGLPKVYVKRQAQQTRHSKNRFSEVIRKASQLNNAIRDLLGEEPMTQWRAEKLKEFVEDLTPVSMHFEVAKSLFEAVMPILGQFVGSKTVWMGVSLRAFSSFRRLKPLRRVDSANVLDDCDPHDRQPAGAEREVRRAAPNSIPAPTGRDNRLLVGCESILVEPPYFAKCKETVGILRSNRALSGSLELKRPSASFCGTARMNSFARPTLQPFESLMPSGQNAHGRRRWEREIRTLPAANADGSGRARRPLLPGVRQVGRADGRYNGVAVGALLPVRRGGSVAILPANIAPRTHGWRGMNCTSPKCRPRRRRGISRSGVRLIELIISGRAPQRQHRLAGKNFLHWRRQPE